MTISKLYEYMTDKEIPESLMPWNVEELLTDKDQDIFNGKISASIFVERLLDMGIGLNDFLYLLKSCKAPMEAYEKAETFTALNPAALAEMLEYSGLSDKEYKQMLYYAEKINAREINRRVREANNEYPDYLPSDAGSEEDEKNEERMESEISLEPDIEEEKPVIYNDDSQRQEDSYSAQPENTGEEYTEKEISKENEEDSADSLDELNPYAEIEQNKEIKESDTNEYYPLNETDTKEYYPVEDDIEYDGEKEEDKDGINDNEYEEPEKKTYHKAAIIFSACFAVILAALSFAADALGYDSASGAALRSFLKYASDESDIFGEVYSEYYAEKPGGTKMTAYKAPGHAVFGGYMVSLPEELGVYSAGKYIFSAEKNLVTVYEINGRNTAAVAELKPPENAEFVKAEVINGNFAAVYSGNNVCGVVGFGEKQFVSRQSGTLTSVTETEYGYALGSVYTPRFTESFSISQTEQYLPWISSDDTNRRISPVNIIFNNSYEGYSYAVYAVHEEGEVKDESAVMGDPLYSGTDGGFSALMLSGENASLVKPDNNEEKTITSIDLGNVLNYTGGAWGAAAVKTEEGKEVVYIYDPDFKPTTKLTNLSDSAAYLYTDSSDGRNYLHVMGNNGGVILTVNITNAASPSLPTLTDVSGIVTERGALLEEYADKKLTLTLITLNEDGVINKEASFSKELPDNLELSGGNTMLISEDGRCGAAYNYFDGVSKVSEYVIFGKDIKEEIIPLFDDKSGFTSAAEYDGHIYIIYGDKVDIK